MDMSPADTVDDGQGAYANGYAPDFNEQISASGGGGDTLDDGTIGRSNTTSDYGPDGVLRKHK